MAITYIKKAEKTAFTGEDETRTKVSSILKDLEKTKDQGVKDILKKFDNYEGCLLYTSPSPRDGRISRMPSSA